MTAASLDLGFRGAREAPGDMPLGSTLKSMGDPDRLDSVKPIKSVEELREETDDAEPPRIPAQEEHRSFLGALLDPLVEDGEGRRQDGTTAVSPSETTENSEG
ncbi:hypothetical protein Dalu01_02955 [Deinococcus aluminii]|uniref:Uncharacterized protein n=2 Tax=Deinococcus aluminii TaxID=1656885 RepID=A0ABP9XGQ5_9DEIO